MKSLATSLHHLGRNRYVTLVLGVVLALVGLLHLGQSVSSGFPHGLAWSLILYGVLRVVQALSMLLSGVDDIEKGELAAAALPRWAKAMIAFSTHHVVNLAVGGIMLVAGVASVTQGIDAAVVRWEHGAHAWVAIGYGVLRVLTSIGSVSSGLAHARGGVLHVPSGPSSSRSRRGPA